MSIGMNLLYVLWFIVFRIEIYHFYIGAFEQTKTIVQTILLSIHYATYARLYDEFGTLYARRCGDIQGAAFAVVVTPCQFGYGIGLSVQHAIPDLYLNIDSQQGSDLKSFQPEKCLALPSILLISKSSFFLNFQNQISNTPLGTSYSPKWRDFP